jgi:glycosyltransferase involved in cell wall biosynthesis
VHTQRYEQLPAQAELRKTLQLPGSKTIACFSGSLYPGRGIENIVYCAERFKDIHFLIIGGSPDEVRHYRDMAAGNGSMNLHFTGYVPSIDVPRYLMAADILLMPNTSKSSGHSIEYASPMKVFDYLASGKPIIASDFPVLREIFTHEHNAFLVPADSDRELARGLQWVLDNPGPAGKMAAQARIDAMNYSWEKRARDYLSFVRTFV